MESQHELVISRGDPSLMYEGMKRGASQIAPPHRCCDENEPTASTSPAGLVPEPIAGSRCIASQGRSKRWLSGRLAVQFCACGVKAPSGI